MLQLRITHLRQLKLSFGGQANEELQNGNWYQCLIVKLLYK